MNRRAAGLCSGLRALLLFAPKREFVGPPLGMKKRIAGSFPNWVAAGGAGEEQKSHVKLACLHF